MMMMATTTISILMKPILVLLVIELVGGKPYGQTKSSTDPTQLKTFNVKDDTKLSPIEHSKDDVDLNSLIEVKEDEIPEGSLVYVLEEPLDQTTDGELLNTASNIAFRPLFRYRGKQQLERRSSHRFKRRYFIPRRSYRHAYYPYYYPYRYYY